METILIIYSFVYFNKIEDKVLLYNIDNGEYIIIELPFSKLFEDLRLNSGKYYVTIDPKYNSNSRFQSILLELELKNLGEVLHVEPSKIPILFSPSFYMDSDPTVNLGEYYLLGDKDYSKEKANIIGKNILNNLQEITIYFNSIGFDNEKLNMIYKQYNFPIVHADSTIINVDELNDFLFPIAKKKLRVNIIIGYVDKSINDECIYLINKYIHIFDIHIYMPLSAFRYFLYPDNIKRIDSIIWIIDSDLKNIKYISSNMVGLCSSNNEYLQFLQKGFDSEHIYPYYTGFNLDFIVKELGYTVKDLMAIKKDDRALFANQNINSNAFGELFIMPNGDIFSDINQSPIGNIKYNSLKSVLHKELTNIQNWFYTRDKVSPCKKCIYNIFCNSITRIEQVCMKYDFCDNSERMK